jgi:hypothetical protein
MIPERYQSLMRLVARLPIDGCMTARQQRRWLAAMAVLLEMTTTRPDGSYHGTGAGQRLRVLRRRKRDNV